MKRHNQNTRVKRAIQRDKDTHWDKETEKQSLRETDDMEETDEGIVLAQRITTIQEAVEISLRQGVHDKSLFVLARALRAFEITLGKTLSRQDCQAAFTQWWHAAKMMLPAGADFDEYRFVFEDAFDKVRAPLGANPLHEAVRRAMAGGVVPWAERYESQSIKHLIAVCWNLYQLNGYKPFFLSVRDAAGLLRISNLNRASAVLSGLVRDGVLRIAKKGLPGGSLATRYHFMLPGEV